MTALTTLQAVLQTGIHSARPAANAVGSGSLYACSTHGLIYQSDGSSWSTWATLGSSVTLATVDAVLGANVTIVNSSTFYDGPSASFAAGTWLINWKILFNITGVTSQTYEFVGRLWDGSTIYDEAQSDGPGNFAANQSAWSFPVSGFAIVTLGATATLKISGGSIRGASAVQMLRDVTTGMAGNSHTATRLSGIKVA